MHRFIVLFVLVSHLAALQATKPAWMEALTEASEWTLDNVVQPHVGDDLWRVVKEITLNATAVIPNAIAKPPYIDEAVVRPMSRYFIGYSVVMSVGILLIVLVPIGGLISCFVRCCCCKQKKDVAASKRSECCSNSCGLLLLLLIGAVTLGCITIYGTVNQAELLLRDPQQNAFQRVANTVDSIDGYINTTVSEVVNTKNEFIQGCEDINMSLDDMLVKISDGIDGIVEPSLDQLHQGLEMLDDALHLIQQNLTEIDHLSELSDDINFNLMTLQTDISDSIRGCTTLLCEDVKNELPKLVTRGYKDYNLKNLIDNVDILLNAVIASLAVSKSNVDDLESVISEEVGKEMEKINDKVDELENVIDNKFAKIVEKIDNSSLSNVSRQIISASPQNNNVTNDMWSYSRITLQCIVALMVAICILYLVGLLHGVFCSNPDTSSNCHCTIKAGAVFMTLGSTISILFYWIFAIVTLVFFVYGGLVHTVVCRQLSTINDSRLIDTLSEVLNTKLPNENVTFDIGLAYSKCSQNQSLFSAVNLQFNLSSSHVNVDVEEQLNKLRQLRIILPQLNFNIIDITKNFTDIDSQMGTIAYAIGMVLGELSQDFIDTNVTDMVDKLNQIASENYSQNITAAMQELNVTNRDLIMDAELQIAALKSIFAAANITLSEVDLTDAGMKLKGTEDEINNDVSGVIGTHTTAAADDISVQIKNLIDGVNVVLREDIGRCYPLYRSVNSMRDLLCDDVIPIFNTIWFAFAWCIICLIIMLFVACKLNTLYIDTFNRTKHQQQVPLSVWVNENFKNDQSDSGSIVVPMEEICKTETGFHRNSAFEDAMERSRGGERSPRGEERSRSGKRLPRGEKKVPGQERWRGHHDYHGVDPHSPTARIAVFPVEALEAMRNAGPPPYSPNSTHAL